MLIGHERAGGLHSGRCGALFGGLGQHGGEVACFGRGCDLGAGSLDAFGQGVRLALEGISDGYGSRRAALGPGDGFRHGRCRRKSAFRCQLREGRLGELPQGGSGFLGFGTTFGLVQKLVQERRDAPPRPGPTVIHVGAQRLKLRPDHPLDFQLTRLRPAHGCAPLPKFSLRAIIEPSERIAREDGRRYERG